MAEAAAVVPAGVHPGPHLPMGGFGGQLKQSAPFYEN